MDISVIVPLLNEAESLPELAAWIERVMAEHNFTYEVIIGEVFYKKIAE